MSHTMSQLPGALRDLYGFRILKDLDIYLADTLRRRFAADTVPDCALLACCLASRVVADGHICLDRTEISPEWLAGLSPDDNLTVEALPNGIDTLCATLKDMDAEDLAAGSCGIIGDPATACPVVVSGDRVYLRRYWKYEAEVAERLRAMSLAGQGTEAGEELTQSIHAREDLNTRQKEAAVKALHSRLTVISGGPGTGKTYTAARILDLLITAGADAERRPVVRMAAPTGKAAARMDESVKKAISEINPDELEAVENASTIDRLLGYVKDSPYYRHNVENPLDADVVLIDEASMIDLPKMAKLLDALDEDCRLVLLGDMHQLASVDPGSVMADICSSKTLKPCVVELDKVERFDQDSPVDQVGRAVNGAESEADAGKAWDLVQQFDDPQYGNQRITQHDVPDYLSSHTGAADKTFAEAITSGYGDFLKTEKPQQAFKALAEFRILCGLRRGPHGVVTLNKLVENILSGKAVPAGTLPEGVKLRKSGEFYDHRVLMVTRNDYGLGLFNGDVGVVMKDDADPKRLVTYFEPRHEGEDPHKVPCRLLPDHETAFAITVHKSQGSEFGRILVLLPDRESPILTKELLYTALTRTGSGVELWCTRAIFEQAAQARVTRTSGLFAQLDAGFDRSS